MPLIDYVVQIFRFLVFQRLETKLIQNKQGRLGELAQPVGIGTVSPSSIDVGEHPGGGGKEGVNLPAAGLMG